LQCRTLKGFPEEGAQFIVWNGPACCKDLTMAIRPSEFLHAPMGGTLVPGGATFRVWAPRANAVHVSGGFNGWTHDGSSRMAPIGGGHWAGFVPGLQNGEQYLFYVEGTGSSGFKRDPRARLLTHQPSFPACNSVLRDATRFPWHQARFTRRHSTISSSTSFMSARFRSRPEMATANSST
jgi:1,4-alpha-glucan branching enzyme